MAWCERCQHRHNPDESCSSCATCVYDAEWQTKAAGVRDMLLAWFPGHRGSSYPQAAGAVLDYLDPDGPAIEVAAATPNRRGPVRIHITAVRKGRPTLMHLGEEPRA